MAKGFRKLTYYVRLEKIKLTSLEKKERSKKKVDPNRFFALEIICFVNEIRIKVMLWITLYHDDSDIICSCSCTAKQQKRIMNYNSTVHQKSRLELRFELRSNFLSQQVVRCPTLEQTARKRCQS